MNSNASLDRARRDWLDGLARQHAANPTADSALELARGAYRCGEYALALKYFTEARDRAPDQVSTQVALVRAASMCGHGEIEREALADALARMPDSPDLQLHAARLQATEDPQAALQRLQPFVWYPLCREFADALTALVEDQPLRPSASVDPGLQARRAGLDWVRRHCSDPRIHVGHPVQVLQRALDAAGDAGLTLECGVYFGRSLRIIASATQGTVHGFDSFEGLPEAWNANEGPGSYSTAGRLPEVPANVVLHRGWFEDTLPPFFAAHADPIRLLHVDCDLYSSTATVLANADAALLPGSIIVFDDLLGYPGYERHELKAFEEFAGQRGIGWELVAATLLGREVAIRITSR